MEGTRAIGYVYVAEGAKADLAEQAAAIRRCCHARGLQLRSVVHDVAHPESGHHRPSLIEALEQVAGGQVDTLVVARLGDLAFNAADVAPLLRWFDQEHRSLIALDTVADAPALDQHIARMRNGGMTLQAIADASTPKACRRCAAVPPGDRPACNARRATDGPSRAATGSSSRTRGARAVTLTSTARAPRRGPGACASPSAPRHGPARRTRSARARTRPRTPPSPRR